MRLRIQLRNGTVYTPEQQALLRRYCTPEPRFHTPEDEEQHSWQKAGSVANTYDEFTLDATGMFAAWEDFACTVVGQDSTSLAAVLHRLVETPPVARLNEHPAIMAVVPDTPVFHVRSVHVLTDACTDNLQRWLNGGWMILCVCPQPARRPDYVLGHLQGPDTVAWPD